VLPEGLGAVVDRGSWDPGPLFRLLQRAGDVERGEMYRVFNMGVGMVAVVDPERVDGVIADLESAGEAPWILGEVEPGDGVRYAG
jgi:phosphoribosylformylglycinamidine cyclo-ligase